MRHLSYHLTLLLCTAIRAKCGAVTARDTSWLKDLGVQKPNSSRVSFKHLTSKVLLRSVKKNAFLLGFVMLFGLQHWCQSQGAKRHIPEAPCGVCLVSENQISVACSSNCLPKLKCTGKCCLYLVGPPHRASCLHCPGTLCHSHCQLCGLFTEQG